MHSKIFSSPTTSVYLYSNTIASTDNLVKTAIKDFLPNYELNCKKPIEIHWNKSDTQEHTVIAVSSENVGIDIEYMKERPFYKISKRYFDGHEVTANKLFFYDTWTRKEAYTKWKKEKIAVNMKERIDKVLMHADKTEDMIPLQGLPDNVIGYLCT